MAGTMTGMGSRTRPVRYLSREESDAFLRAMAEAPPPTPDDTGWQGLDGSELTFDEYRTLVAESRAGLLPDRQAIIARTKKLVAARGRT